MKQEPVFSPRFKNGGFTLIEMSIVMIIVGLIIAGGLSVFGPSMRQALKTKNETIVRHAVDTLIGFSGAHKSLPQDLTGVVNTPNDAQNNPLQYAYDARLIQANVCDYQDVTNLTVATASFTVPNIAFVVWSKGYNGTTEEAGWSVGGVEKATTYTVAEYSDGAVNNPSANKDDLLGWATIYELKAAAGCSSPLKILARSVPHGVFGKSYGTAQFMAMGGSSYSWCVEASDSIKDALTYGSTMPVNGFGECSAARFLAGGASLMIHGKPPNGMPAAGSYDLNVYLKDGSPIPATTSRLFVFKVKESDEK
ncbi:MAG: type II secretion system protein [Magnetococcales bacterium]|nr:type II secretion system protein [Magnetococcales bacterium]